MNPHAIEGVFIGYTEHPSQYLIWVSKRREIMKATNLIFVEDDQQLPEQPTSLDLAELGKAQQGKAQQIENPSSDKNSTDSSNENNESLTQDDRAVTEAIQALADENQELEQDQQPSQLGATTRAS